jgi:transcriptional regulator with XRE-family HTH domain
MCSTRQRLAALLREERRFLGLNLRQAAARAEIAAATLSRWESGACVPRVPELESLLKSLQVDSSRIERILASLDVPRAATAVRKGSDPSRSVPSGGDLLRALRNRSGYPLAKIAALLGVAASTVSRWESSSAHPPKEMLELLLGLLGATPDERACIENSGVAKLNAERTPFDEPRYRKEIERIESGASNYDGFELRLLQLKTILWWSNEEPGASELLKRVHTAYAHRLNAAGRYGEAAVEAEAALSRGSIRGDAVTVDALRELARADVYRRSPNRPHLALFTLEKALKIAEEPASRTAVLRDMAEYCAVAGRIQEAELCDKRAKMSSPRDHAPVMAAVG